MSSPQELFQRVLSNSMDIQRKKNVIYLSPEVFTHALIREKLVADMVAELGGDPKVAKEELEKEIERQPSAGFAGGQGKMSQTIDNIIKKQTALLSTSEADDCTEADILFALVLDIIDADLIDNPAKDILAKHGATRDAVDDYRLQNGDQAESVLDKYCVNLNTESANGQIDPVIGREKEVNDTVEILARRKKNNVVFVGEPGVGKTAIAEGLARQIQKGEVPDAIKDMIVYSLDVGTLVAGTKFRGELEERFKKIIKEVEAKGNVIMFIDEMHMIMGAGATSGGTMDVSNMLKPSLASGKIKLVGATTEDEFTEHLQKDRALMRRVQKITVNEPNVEDTKRIVKGIVKYYTDFHGVEYAEGVVDVAVELADRYIAQRFFPDKAIDIIDATGATAKLEGVDTVDISRVISAVSKMSNIPVDMIDVKENDLVKALPAKMRNEVFGQDHAIELLTDSITIAKSGLRDTNKPIGNFLFVGPTGTGKTHICKRLADNMATRLVRFDMSEYQERHTVSKLIGAPPGYVGHGEGKNGDGQLIYEVANNPNCILLLDEIEKAAPEVAQILLQIMDDGRLTSASGKTVDFSNVILIMTSNLGAQDADKQGIGFGATDFDSSAINDAVKKYFPPEFRNRVDHIIQFNKLEHEQVEILVDVEMQKLNAKLVKQNVRATMSVEARSWLASKGYQPALGARPLSRIFEQHVKLPISKQVLFGSLVDGGLAHIELDTSSDTIVVAIAQGNLAHSNHILTA